jgi:hypothetical protein
MLEGGIGYGIRDVHNLLKERACQEPCANGVQGQEIFDMAIDPSCLAIFDNYWLFPVKIKGEIQSPVMIKARSFIPIP